MKSNLIINTGEGNSDKGHRLRAHYLDQLGSKSDTVSEIEEEFSSELFEINDSGVSLGTIKEEVEGSVFSFDFHSREDIVYVVVGKNEETSMDALLWTVNHAVNPSTSIVFLIYVFPEVKFIPTPLGKLPISQVNNEQTVMHLAQERGKRRVYLQKFLDICSKSQVKVDTLLIESDQEAKAILDLIPILNIKKLVLGTTKSNLRRIKLRKSSVGVVDQVLHDAPEYCEVKIISEGKEMGDHMSNDSESPSPSPQAADQPRKSVDGQDEPSIDLLPCCFSKPKVMF